MKTKISNLSYLTFIFALIWSVNLSLSVNGQKIGGDKAKDQDKTLQVLQNDSVLSPVGAYNLAASDYKDEPNQLKRNKLIFMAISQIDLNFGQYIRGKRHKNSYFQTVIDVLEVAAATAISITNGERAKSIIADGLGFVQGSRSSINKNLRLLEQQILVNKMIEKRSKTLAVIYEKINDSEEQYPFERAFIDILAYYQAGTMDSALSSLATDSGNSANSAQNDLEKAKIKARIRLAPTAAEIKTSRVNMEFVQKFIDTHLAALKKITATDELIKTANAAIAAENEKANPDASLIAAEKQKITNGEAEKVTAEQNKKNSLDKLKQIFNSVKADLVLAPLLEKLPEKHLKDSDRLSNIQNDKGDINDYGNVILHFFSLVTESIKEDSTISERAKNILESVK